MINLADKRFFDIKYEEEVLDVLPDNYIELLSDDERKMLYHFEFSDDSYIINRKKLMKLCEKINISLADTDMRMVLLPILKTKENIKSLDIKYKFLRKTSTIIIKIKNSEIYNYFTYKYTLKLLF